MYPYDAADAYAVGLANVYRETAQRLGIDLLEKELQTKEEARAVFAQLHQGEVDGIVAPSSPSLNILGFIQKAASQQAIPTMYATAFFPEHGGLASYGPSAYESGKQAARLVDKILKGANPADIPIEVNAKIEFVINLKVAKALGLTIPPEVLFQANKVVR